MLRKNIFTIILLFFIANIHAQTGLPLAEAKSKAVQNQVAIKNIELEVAAAKLMQRKAKSFYYPQVGADVFAMHAIDPLLEMNNPGGNLPVYDGDPANLATATEFAYFPASSVGLLQKLGVANIGATQPIYTGGRLKTANELAALGVDIREEQQTMTQKEVELRTEQQYWQIVALQEKQKTIDEYKKLLDRIYVQVQDAFTAGLIIRNDVYKVELEQSQLLLNENRLQNGKSLAIRQFCNTIGEDYQADLLLQDELDDYEDPAYYLKQNDSYLAELSEVKLLEQSVAVQDLQIEMKAAENRPTIGLGANALYLTQFADDTGGFNAMGFVSINVPLTHYWTAKFDVEEQKVRKQIAVNTLDDTKRLLELRTAKAWTDMQEAYEQIQIMEQRIVQADENLKVNQSSYDSGLVTLADLLEAKALQVQAQDELIDAKTKYKTAIAAYIDYTAQ